MQNKMQLDRYARELAGLKAVFEQLVDGDMHAAGALNFIKSNYKRWAEIIKWLSDNKLTGKRLVEFFQNESTNDGGGYHLGVTHILSRIDGLKHQTKIIKANELIGRKD